MRTFLLGLSVLLATAASNYAQTANAVFYSAQGERFFLYVNGVCQNGSPVSNIRISGLTFPNFSSRIAFENPRLGYIDNTVNLMADAENNFLIGLQPTGMYGLTYQGATPFANYTQTVVPNQQMITYHSTPLPGQQTITTTTTTYNDGFPDDNINMNMSLGGIGINMNVNNGWGTTTQQTTTTTTYGQPAGAVVTYSQPTTTVINTPPPAPPVMPGYSGPVGCPAPMQPNEFQSLKATIASKSFEQSKLTIAKQVIANRCMFTQQVKELMMLFDFEQSRLEVAKIAYASTYDRGNYFQINDAFTFESSISDLQAYIGRFR